MVSLRHGRGVRRGHAGVPPSLSALRTRWRRMVRSEREKVARWPCHPQRQALELDASKETEASDASASVGSASQAGETALRAAQASPCLVSRRMLESARLLRSWPMAWKNTLPSPQLRTHA